MKLLEPYDLGPLRLPNRTVMAPLTRNRAPGTVQAELAALYCAQRASAGLIVTEGTQVSRLGQGYQETPGIFTDEQVDAWRRVTGTVHAAGGRMFAQLWHVGRASHSFYHGERPVAPSPIRPPGKAYTPEGMKPYETPRELTTAEVRGVVEAFGRGAARARDAGFDGVEIHGANGYLVDQFLRTGTNHREDEYGGPVESRARFLLEVTAAAAEAWAPERVGLRLSPGGTMNGVHDDDPVATFSHAGRALSGLGLAYLHVVEAPVGAAGVDEREVCATELMREAYDGTLITASGYDRASAERAVRERKADLVAFGRAWLANPDLVARLALDAPLNEPDRSTFYGGGEAGYTDYPLLSGLPGDGAA